MLLMTVSKMFRVDVKGVERAHHQQCAWLLLAHVQLQMSVYQGVCIRANTMRNHVEAQSLDRKTLSDE